MKLSNSTDNTASATLRPHRSGSFEIQSAIGGVGGIGHAPLVTPDSLSLHSMRLPGGRLSTFARGSDDSLNSLDNEDDDNDDDEGVNGTETNDRFDSSPEHRSPPVPAPRSAPQRPPPPHPLALVASNSSTLHAPQYAPPAHHHHHHHHPTPSQTRAAPHHSHPITALPSSAAPTPPAPTANSTQHNRHIGATAKWYGKSPNMRLPFVAGNGFENDFVNDPSSLGGAGAIGASSCSSTSTTTSSTSVVNDGPFARQTRNVAKEPPTSPNLITLDTSFDVEDFDPLNQNARKLPAIANTACLPAKPLRFAAPGGGSSVNSMPNYMGNMYKPVYPSAAGGMSAGSRQNATDADVELLRKYGLDKFSLSTGGGTSNSGGASTAGASSSTATAARRNWTDFD